MISTGLPAPLLANSASQSWAEIELPAPCHPNPAATPAASSASKKDGMSEMPARAASHNTGRPVLRNSRSEEHTSELQSLMRITYAVFCLKKKKKEQRNTHTRT